MEILTFIDVDELVKFFNVLNITGVLAFVEDFKSLLYIINSLRAGFLTLRVKKYLPFFV